MQENSSTCRLSKSCVKNGKRKTIQKFCQNISSNQSKSKTDERNTPKHHIQPHLSHPGLKNEAEKTEWLHKGRGATAWGREDGGDDATEAGGGNLRSNSDLPIFPDLESLSVPKTPIRKITELKLQNL